MQPANKLLLPLRSSQYLTPSLFLLLLLSASFATSPTRISILFLFLHAVHFVPPLLPPLFPFFFFYSPLLTFFSVDILLLFRDLKPRVPPTPSVRLMFDKGPLKFADFRGCLADGLVGLQRVQAGGLPSERDQLLPRHRPPPSLLLTHQPGTAKGTGYGKIWGRGGPGRRFRFARGQGHLD